MTELLCVAAGLPVGGVAGYLLHRLRLGAAYRTRDDILEQARVRAEHLVTERKLAAKEELLGRREKVEAELEADRNELRQLERRLEQREVRLGESRDIIQEREAAAVVATRQLDAREELLVRREELAREVESQREELRQLERRLDKRESLLDEARQAADRREAQLEGDRAAAERRSSELDERERRIDVRVREQDEELRRISGLGREEATELLLERLRADLTAEQGEALLEQERRLREHADEQAREIVGMAVQRLAASHTAETTVSTVDIPSDDVKGRIIGRDGRNIRSFEKTTGVDVIVDDTPGVVVVSAFDTVRREVARLSLEKLIEDGRIHPTRIEEVVAETQTEMDAHIAKLGREAAAEVGVTGLHDKLLELMGRLEFRTSYSQNVRRHSVEVAFLTGLMAEQLKLDGPLARRCGFLHDLGKAADHEMEGGHPAVGAELLKRYGECEEVVHAARGHHDDIRPEHIYTVLVAAADAVSAGRPGARRDSLERYVRRLEELEALACGFPGVEQAYAVQAGREVRVIVDAREVDDREAAVMSREIAEAVESTLTYPGEVRITVLRETRVVSVAR